MGGMVATILLPNARPPCVFLRVLGIVLVGLAPAVHAGVLYKSIGPNGVIQFSDTPPGNGMIVEERTIGSTPAAPATAGSPLATLDDGNADDAELARANEKVDLAEHALALARRALDGDSVRMRLASQTRTPADDDRIAFFEKDLTIARHNLLEMLKSRRATLAAAAAEPGAPQFGPLRRIASR
jgi:hypothetical protein